MELLPSGFVDQNKLLLGALFNPGAFSQSNRKVTNMKSLASSFCLLLKGFCLLVYFVFKYFIFISWVLVFLPECLSMNHMHALYPGRPERVSDLLDL